MYHFSAVEDFYKAHRKASLQEIVATLAGRQSDLLRYDEILRKLHSKGQSDKGLQDIPLNAIAGSVGRYLDFTRDFLPKRINDKDRWVNVKAAMMGLKGVPPIEVYRVGEVYFVKDGNHRVSVAREMGHKYIQAYVVEINTLVPLGIDDDLADIIIKSEYADFLDKTNFHKIFPDVELEVTLPGQYEKLEEHIQVHRYFMGLEEKRHIPYQEALEHWYRHVYSPVEEAIEDQGILRDFPGRKTADLYLWIMKYRDELEKDLGWRIKEKFLIPFFKRQFGTRAVSGLKKLLLWIKSLWSAVFEDAHRIDDNEKRMIAPQRKLFENILVAVYDSPASWKTLEQAIMISERENGEIFGLHVVEPGSLPANRPSDIRERFDQLCRQRHVKGTLAIEQGKIAEKIIERSYWVDLVVLNLAHPPQTQILAKLNSGFHSIISRLGRPLLAVPGDAVVGLTNCLVGYDGSPKSKEALYVAAYLAINWGAFLTVVHVEENEQRSRWILKEAKSYLETHQVKANYVVRRGNPADVILSEVSNLRCDLIVIGSYGYSQVFEVVLGSTVDRILLESWCPVLICR